MRRRLVNGHGDSRDCWTVGVLFSQTGVTSVIEETQLRATLLAIEEINERGGIRGRPLRHIVYDPGSCPDKYGRLADILLKEHGASILFGCYMSSARRAVLPRVEKANALLCYSTFYEGFEYSANAVYFGSVPNQANLILVDYLLRHHGNRIYLFGSDYIFPKEANRVLRSIITHEGGRVVGERYVPLDSSVRTFDLFMEELKLVQPDVILSTVVGVDIARLYTAYREAGFDSRKMPIASITTTEAELSQMDPEVAVGHITCGTYFAGIKTAESETFLAKYRRFNGTSGTPNMCAEAAYSSVKMVCGALEDTNDDDPHVLISALHGRKFDSPQGEIQVDRDNNHAYLWCRIGRVSASRQFELVYEFPGAIKPDPYLVDYRGPAAPAARTKWLDEVGSLASQERSNEER